MPLPAWSCCDPLKRPHPPLTWSGPSFASVTLPKRMWSPAVGTFTPASVAPLAYAVVSGPAAEKETVPGAPGAPGAPGLPGAPGGPVVPAALPRSSARTPADSRFSVTPSWTSWPVLTLRSASFVRVTASRRSCRLPTLPSGSLRRGVGATAEREEDGDGRHDVGVAQATADRDRRPAGRAEGHAGDRTPVPDDAAWRPRPAGGRRLRPPTWTSTSSPSSAAACLRVARPARATWRRRRLTRRRVLVVDRGHLRLGQEEVGLQARLRRPLLEVLDHRPQLAPRVRGHGRNDPPPGGRLAVPAPDGGDQWPSVRRCVVDRPQARLAFPGVTPIASARR